jgi:pyruvate dehydrogenase E2 component (dihydrolipoamide acetyltransferase)
MASEVKLPELGESLTGGDVLDIRVAPGDIVRMGQTLLEVEAEKATIEVPSPVAGRVTRLLVRRGEAIQVGQVVCLIEETVTAAVPEPAGVATAEATAFERTEQPTGNGQRARAGVPADERPEAAKSEVPRKTPVPAGPATRRLARELGIDLTLVRGTAPSGRVSQDDVKAYVRALASGKAARVPAAPAPLPDFERWGVVERRPLEMVRRKTAEQMSLAWSLVPHVTQHDQADITELEVFRKQQEGRGPKLTVTSFVLKAAAIALQQFPDFNSSLDVAAGQLIHKRYYHVGVAVDTERGLLVPVLRDVNKKSVQELAEELVAIAERARQKKIQPDELRGGTFTITNLGGIGGTGFTPIVNYPEVAILGLSRSRVEPVVRDTQVVPRMMLPLSLSYDHRVIDGANAARFTRRIVEMLENPLVMLIHA